MKYTKEQLQAMSDFEVNKALAWLVMMVMGKETWTFNNNKDKVQFFDEKTQKSRVVDYCSTPNDIMPMAFEHLVNTQWFMDSKEVRAYTHSGKSVIVSYQNCSRQQAALRAHACCLILVIQGEKE